MPFEYHVIPAPETGRKRHGAHTVDARYAAALTETLNRQAADGWEFVGAEVLPCHERKGLGRTRIVYVNMLIFRREAVGADQHGTEAALRLFGHDQNVQN